MESEQTRTATRGNRGNNANNLKINIAVANFNNISAMKVGPDGKLYVAD